VRKSKPFDTSVVLPPSSDSLSCSQTISVKQEQEKGNEETSQRRRGFFSFIPSSSSP